METELEAIDRQLKDLRLRITEVGQEIDAYRATSAAAVGGGVFLLLLAAVAWYDLAIGKAELWLTVGIGRSMLETMAIALGALGALLLVSGFLRHHKRDRNREEDLERMEAEFAGLLDQRDLLSTPNSVI